jgi:uncharacterized protein
MSQTIIDLGRLTLSHGEGTRLDVPVRLDPFELGGQTYLPLPDSPTARLDISRPSGGFAFRLRLQMHLEGPCMRCLEPAQLDLDVEAREVDQSRTEDEEMHSPYVVDDQLDLSRWAEDAIILALPNQLLCREDCAGLCPTCGEPLNDNPDHHHDATPDPRWAKLDDLKLE